MLGLKDSWDSRDSREVETLMLNLGFKNQSSTLAHNRVNNYSG